MNNTETSEDCTQPRKNAFSFSDIALRFFDIIFSFIAIMVLLPFMIPIMLVLKLTGEHDIFYAQERIGRFGRPFKLLKFATMLRNSPNMDGGMFTVENDPRILPMGRFLRKTKINELPQLLNILCGQMSVIGYRPTVKEFYDKYPEDVKKKILCIRPGLSGIGSVVFRDEEEILQKIEDKESFDSNIITPYKGELEAWYADHRSVIMYFRLIVLTVDAVLHPQSQKWKNISEDIPDVPSELTPYL